MAFINQLHKLGYSRILLQRGYASTSTIVRINRTGIDYVTALDSSDIISKFTIVYENSATKKK